MIQFEKVKSSTKQNFHGTNKIDSSQTQKKSATRYKSTISFIFVVVFADRVRIFDRVEFGE